MSEEGRGRPGIDALSNDPDQAAEARSVVASLPESEDIPRQAGPLVRYSERLNNARAVMTASHRSNGERGFTIAEAAALDEIYVSGAARRRHDAEITRLRRALSKSLEFADEEDGAA